MTRRMRPACPQCHPGPSADPYAPLCMWHASERVRERMARERMRAAGDPIPASGPALPTAYEFAGVWLALRDVLVTLSVHRSRENVGRDWPVNWARLRADEVEWFIAYDKEVRRSRSGWRVTFSGAAPEATAFREYVEGALADAGYPGVEVVTVW